jgi:membrane associated rhomboid family serine protease
MNATYIIIGITCVLTFFALNNENLFNQMAFWPEKVWHDKEYHRMLTGGFIHVDYSHLLFNMISLFFFGPTVELYFYRYFDGGIYFFVAFYMVAVIVAQIPDLLQQRHNYYYRGVGASGAVSATVFACILFAPLTEFYIGIPGVIFGVLYLAYSIFMSRKGGDNVAHLAHFGGAIFGFLFPLCLQPSLFQRFLSQITHAL